MKALRGREAVVAVLHHEVTEGLRRRRVLDAWEEGDRLLEWGEGLLHVFSRPRSMRVDSVEGTPVVVDGPGWATHRAKPPPPAGVLRVYRDGSAQEGLLAEAPLLDPSDWLELDPTEVLRTRSLAPPPGRLPEVGTREVGRRVDLRARAGIGNGGSRRAALLRALERLRGRRPKALPEGERARGGAERGRAARGGGASARPPGEGGGLWPRVGRWLARFGLAGWLEDRHARMLERLVATFREGDLDEALRLAVPLGDGAGEATPPVLSPRATLARRERLEFGSRPTEGATIVGEEDRIEVLRAHYRRAFTRLKAEGRTREAAFVLAELLGAHREAVLYLEEAEDFPTAAELAEAADLEPALRARLWIRSGGHDRAVEIARRAGVFALVVEALRARAPALAHELAQEWAEDAAEKGDLRTALEAAPDHPASEAWIERGLASGGLLEAELLPRALERRPDRWSELALRFERLARLDDPDAPLRLARMAEALARPELEAPVRRALAGALARAWVARGVDAPEDRPRVARLARASEDPLLQATLPSQPELRPGPAQEDEIRWGTKDRGRFPIFDAVRLENGRWVLALGPSGVLFLNENGRALAHRPHVPVRRLHVAPGERRAVGTEPAGGRLQVALIDLESFAVRPWAEAPCAQGAETDGREWAVVLEGGREAALVELPGGASAPPRLVWRSGGEGCVLGLSWRNDELELVRSTGSDVWYERFDVARDRLLERRDVGRGAERHGFSMQSGLRYLEHSKDGVALVSPAGRVAMVARDLEHPGTILPTASGWFVHRSSETETCGRWMPASGGPPLVVSIDGPTAGLSAREHGGLLIFFDAQGRAEAFRDRVRVFGVRS